MKLLFVCKFGLMRSVTGAAMFDVEGVETRARGWDHFGASLPLREADIAWADEIVAVEQSIVTRMCGMYPSAVKAFGKDIIALQIPDRFDRYSPLLQRCLTEQLAGRLPIRPHRLTTDGEVLTRGELTA